MVDVEIKTGISTVKSIRKLTGSYYTPRKVILEMVNESLFLYLYKFIEKNHSDIPDHKKELMELAYHNIAPGDNKALCSAVVNALDRYKVLDPA